MNPSQHKFFKRFNLPSREADEGRRRASSATAAVGWLVGWMAETKENFLINDFQPERGRGESSQHYFNSNLWGLARREAGSTMSQKSIVLVKRNEIFGVAVLGPSTVSITALLHIN